MNDFGEIQYEGFLYKISEELPKDVVELITGHVGCEVKKIFWKASILAKLVIEENRLFIVGATIALDEKSFRLLDLGSQQISKYQREDRWDIDEASGKIMKIQYYEVVYENLHVPYNYTGKVCAYQVYVDEINSNVKSTHKQKNFFVIKNGELCLAESSIVKNPTTKLSEFTWHENRIMEQSNSDYRRNYFVNPKGTVWQNEWLIQMVVSYLKKGQIEKENLDKIFDNEMPVLRVECMVETAPKSNQFKYCVYDLVETAKMKADNDLLQLIQKYMG